MPTEINGTTGVSQVQAGATSGGLPTFQCRAWVNFDGTRDSTGALSTANTARLIRASGNVSSVVRNGQGNYTVNFTTPMSDANFAIVGMAGDSANSAILSTPSPFQTGLVNVTAVSRIDAAGLIDVANIQLAIFR